MGSTALAVLTLLKCGVPKDDTVIVKAFAFLKDQEMRYTYSVAVLLMALDARYAPARDPFAVENVDRYGNRHGKDPCANEITPADKAWMEKGVAFLLEHQKADGYWRYPSGDFDTSNTQFALLGLHAATRCEVKISQRVWLDALRFMLEFQEKDGEPVMYKANEVRGKYRFEWTERAIARGFKYARDSSVPSASMTSAGLTCLVICQSRLWRARAFTGKLRADTRRGVRDAMAWLQTHFAVDHNPGGHHHWTFYNLYGLERAGVLGRYRFLGTHDWYKAGAGIPVHEAGQEGLLAHGQALGGFLLRPPVPQARYVANERPRDHPQRVQRGGDARERGPSPDRGSPRRACRRRPRSWPWPSPRPSGISTTGIPDVVFMAAVRLGYLGPPPGRGPPDQAPAAALRRRRPRRGRQGAGRAPSRGRRTRADDRPDREGRARALRGRTRPA